MRLSVGTRVGLYEIQSLIGAGGMGEVYRARDTALQRDVAIKLLPEAFAHDSEHLARLGREARMLASLNHPNIAIIHGFEDAGGTYAIVMEHVEGTTLADRIAQGPMSIDEVWPIAEQIADALEVAHTQAIVHRDLKPANIKLRPDGVVKVLDFGLAKLTQDSVPGPPSSLPDLTKSPTITTPALTQAGVILGTAAYMAPEQARGKPTDQRADIWAFGVVLYEMLTGRRLFSGEDVTETIAAVVKEQPDLTQVPIQVRRLLGSCLQKDPKKRLHAIGDMRLLLDHATPAIDVASRRRFENVAWAAAGAAVLSTAALALVHFREVPPEAPVIHSTILAPEKATFDFTDGRGLPALSPDGRRLVFGARTSDGATPLWVRSLDGLVAQPLAGTEGATFPFWSPDGQFIAFFADGKLKKIDASGGPALTLTDAPTGRGGSWSRDGVIIFAPSFTAGPLLRVSSAGGAASPVSAESGSFPWFLPDGRHFLFQEQRGSDTQSLPIRVGSLEGSPSATIADGTNAIYARGHLLFLRDNTLMAQPFDTERLATTGESVPVAERVQSVLGSGRVGVFSASESGLVAYREAPATLAVLTWFDRGGQKGASVGDATRQDVFELSPDQKRVASVIQGPEGEDIWIYDIVGGLRTRLTFDASRDVAPVWSPDARSIVFSSNRKGRFDLYRKAVAGIGVEELLYADDFEKFPRSWSPDGKWLLYESAGFASKTGRDLWALPMVPERPGTTLKPTPLLQTSFTELSPRFSPDGRWILYISNESQRVELYVMPFPPPTAGSNGKRQVSTGGGGGDARWRPDGREVFYTSSDRQLMAAEVVIENDVLEVRTVRRLFALSDSHNGMFAPMIDGRLLMLTAPERPLDQPLTLMQNWSAGLK